MPVPVSVPVPVHWFWLELLGRLNPFIPLSEYSLVIVYDDDGAEKGAHLNTSVIVPICKPLSLFVSLSIPLLPTPCLCSYVWWRDSKSTMCPFGMSRTWSCFSD